MYTTYNSIYLFICIPLAPVSAIVGMKWSDAQENSTSEPGFACTSREEALPGSQIHAPFWGKKETLFKKGSSDCSAPSPGRAHHFLLCCSYFLPENPSCSCCTTTWCPAPCRDSARAQDVVNTDQAAPAPFVVPGAEWVLEELHS